MKILPVLLGSILITLVCFATPLYAQNFNFPFNDTMTTPFGPAFADVIFDQSTNFLPCEGGPIALCYYSGPETETCELTTDGKAANCLCFEIAYGPYFVLITAILNLNIYNETVKVCGLEGGNCTTTNSAPVCEAINSGTFIPGTDVISTFSLQCAVEETIGCTDCPQSQLQLQPNLYAGCMTAPCTRTAEDGIVNCLCPTFDGPYQVGLNNQTCDLEEDLVWSAAFNPMGCNTVPPIPPVGCFPDAPATQGGCPLLMEGQIPDVPEGISCDTVCEEYAGCVDDSTEVELGFTCDAVLCTSTCQDQNLVGEACTGLQSLSCSTSEIIKLEAKVGCSCCASQICGCEANSQTEQAIFNLNQDQRDTDITPQCDTNGTLCGESGSSTCALAPAGAQKSFPLYLLVLGLIVLRRYRRK